MMGPIGERIRMGVISQGQSRLRVLRGFDGKMWGPEVVPGFKPHAFFPRWTLLMHWDSPEAAAEPHCTKAGMRTHPKARTILNAENIHRME